MPDNVCVVNYNILVRRLVLTQSWHISSTSDIIIIEIKTILLINIMNDVFLLLVIKSNSPYVPVTILSELLLRFSSDLIGQ